MGLFEASLYWLVLTVVAAGLTHTFPAWEVLPAAVVTAALILRQK